MQISPQIVPRHTRHYTGMSTEHSRGWQYYDMRMYVNRALKGLRSMLTGPKGHIQHYIHTAHGSSNQFI